MGVSRFFLGLLRPAQIEESMDLEELAQSQLFQDNLPIQCLIQGQQEPTALETQFMSERV